MGRKKSLRGEGLRRWMAQRSIGTGDQDCSAGSASSDDIQYHAHKRARIFDVHACGMDAQASEGNSSDTDSTAVEEDAAATLLCFSKSLRAVTVPDKVAENKVSAPKLSSILPDPNASTISQTPSGNPALDGSIRALMATFTDQHIPPICKALGGIRSTAEVVHAGVKQEPLATKDLPPLPSPFGDNWVSLLAGKGKCDALCPV